MPKHKDKVTPVRPKLPARMIDDALMFTTLRLAPDIRDLAGWQKARQEQPMREWFGYVPSFIITLTAAYYSQCSDIEFCALVEREGRA